MPYSDMDERLYMAVVTSFETPADVARFREAVRERLRGQVRRKARGCRTGHYVLREAALPAFRELAGQYGVEVDVYDAATLERPGR